MMAHNRPAVPVGCTAVTMQRLRDKKEKSTRAFSKQRLAKHVPASMNTNTKIWLLLETVFYSGSVRMAYKEKVSASIVYSCS